MYILLKKTNIIKILRSTDEPSDFINKNELNLKKSIKFIKSKYFIDLWDYWCSSFLFRTSLAVMATRSLPFLCLALSATIIVAPVNGNVNNL